jgi:hypothetical protein
MVPVHAGRRVATCLCRILDNQTDCSRSYKSNPSPYSVLIARRGNRRRVLREQRLPHSQKPVHQCHLAQAEMCGMARALQRAVLAC